MNTTWIVTDAAGVEHLADVGSDLPDHVAERIAMCWVRRRGVMPFAGRPQGRTGISYRAHVGRACPVHPDA
jgi:hypothetical protein